MSIDVHERTTAYLVKALLRHLGYDENAQSVARLEVLPMSVRVTLHAEAADGRRFVGGPNGDDIALETREHPMDWPGGSS